ncbi:hypothetical protein B0H10DRAFT_2064158 [Mycena sp. CBHHK59/15]|nr:hypothetical protein B0H10DRAFT_2064158 [Mycena sp. CBHHK59/15]
MLWRIRSACLPSVVPGFSTVQTQIRGVECILRFDAVGGCTNLSSDSLTWLLLTCLRACYSPGKYSTEASTVDRLQYPRRILLLIASPIAENLFRSLFLSCGRECFRYQSSMQWP